MGLSCKFSRENQSISLFSKKWCQAFLKKPSGPQGQPPWPWHRGSKEHPTLHWHHCLLLRRHGALRRWAVAVKWKSLAHFFGSRKLKALFRWWLSYVSWWLSWKLPLQMCSSLNLSSMCVCVCWCWCCLLISCARSHCSSDQLHRTSMFSHRVRVHEGVATTAPFPGMQQLVSRRDRCPFEVLETWHAKILEMKTATYCGWKKSCTSWELLGTYETLEIMGL